MKDQTCSSCGGSGTVECPGCEGSGNRVIGETKGWSTCARCGGKGTITCPSCRGTGFSKTKELDD